MGFRENLKSELEYSGILVKELSAKTGIKKYSLDNYLNNRGQLPSVEVGVKIAKALGVSVEYLVTGEERKVETEWESKREIRAITLMATELNSENRKFVMDFLRWLKARQKGK